MMLRVFLSGEGKADIGNAAAPKPYDQPVEPGVIQALLAAALPEPWQAVGACCWKDVRKYRAGDHRRPEARTVLGLALAAREHGAQVLAFARDRDRDQRRQAEIDAAVAEVTGVHVVGGVAVEAIEAWVLAALGDARSERHARPKVRLERQFGLTAREQLVAAVEGASLDALPPDATSLHAWLARARSATGQVRG